MARTPVLNERRLVIGYIDEVGNGKQTALDKNALTLGFYDPVSNETLDRNRLFVGKGNQLMGLIYKGR